MLPQKQTDTLTDSTDASRGKKLPRTTYLVGVGSQLLVIGRGRFLSRLLLPLGALAEEDVVDEGVLQQGQEDKHKAAHQVHVNSLHVGDLRERLSQVGVDGGHGQHRSDPWRSAESHV